MLREAMRQLMRLQKTDALIDEANAVLARCARGEELALARGAVDAAEVAARELRALLDGRRRDARGNEDDARDLHVKLVEQENRLYSGKITNPKELDQMQHKIEEMRQAVAAFEERALEAMYAIEELAPRLSQAEERAAVARRELAEAEGRVREDQRRAEAQLERLPARRAALVASIDPALLREYEALRARRAGVAVVTIERGACPACGMAVPPMLRHQMKEGLALVKCENCGRLLCCDAV